MYATPYQCDRKHCNLCLTEKYVIVHADQEHLLKCRHRSKYLKTKKRLSNVVVDL